MTEQNASAPTRVVRRLAALWPLCAAIAILLAAPSLHAQTDTAGSNAMDFDRDHLMLNGTWERLFGQPDAEMWKPAAAGTWQPVVLPGALDPTLKRPENEQVQCVWVRRTFVLDARQAARQAVLKWGHVRFGASAWLNGTPLGSHATIGPSSMLVPPGTARTGQNVLVLKVNGWAGLHKSAKGAPVIPVGADMHWGGRAPAVSDDVWLEFYDRARLDWALAVPDPSAGTVTFRVRPESAVTLPAALDLAAEVRFADKPVGTAQARMAAGEASADLTVRLSEVKEWTPAEPQLYTARLTLSAAGAPCDEVTFRFGMRQIGVSGGHYEMNGRPLWFRGSNLVSEWLWGPFNAEAKRYLVDEARNMNLNSFRTHTLPPPTAWLDLCDQYGTMILAEFPTTFNYQDFGFTLEEWEMWHRNVLADATGWITKIWNHPSVVMWVLTNESRDDNDWEAGPFQAAVMALDPTRPTMRTGETRVGTQSAVDIHLCGNYSDTPSNNLITICRDLAAHKDPLRALDHSEYMNIFGTREQLNLRRLGRTDAPDSALDFAECAAEHTEAMRQVNFDMILPYMYAGWPRFRGNDWRPDYPTPMAAALHSSMAPVLVTVDLFDRNFEAGDVPEAALHFINELHEDVKARLDIYVTPQNPLFVPDPAALEKATWHESRDIVLKADSHTTEWEYQLAPLPHEDGTSYLALVLTREGDRPVVSQRTVHTIERGRQDHSGRQLGHPGPALLIGDQWGLSYWCQQYQRIPWRPFTAQDAASPGVLLVCGGRLPADPDLRRATQAFAERGGRVVLFCAAKGGKGEKAQFDWPVPFTVEGTDGSMCVFPYPNADHALLRDIRPDWLRVWNGLPSVIVDTFISGDLVEKGDKLLWEDNPGRPVAMRLPVGKGEVVILTLRMDGRLEPGKRQDFVAERMVLNLLAP